MIGRISLWFASSVAVSEDADLLPLGRDCGRWADVRIGKQLSSISAERVAATEKRKILIIRGSLKQLAGLTDVYSIAKRVRSPTVRGGKSNRAADERGFAQTGTRRSRLLLIRVNPRKS